ncbi:MAG: MFS transporter [Thermoprotei archaeon]
MNRESWLLAFSGGVTGFVWGANTVVLPLYMRALGLGSFTIGILISSSVLLGSTLSLAISLLADLHGRKKFVYLNTATTLTALLLYSTGKPNYLVAGYLIGSTGWTSGTLRSVLLAESAKNEIQRAFSLSSSINTLFAFTGSLGAAIPSLFNYTIWGYRTLFIAEASAALLSIALITPVHENSASRRRVSTASLKLALRFGVDSLIGLGAGLLLPLLPLWFNLRFGVNSAQLAPVFAASQLTLAIGQLLSYRVAAKIGRVWAVVACESAATALLFIIPLSPSFPLSSTLIILRNTLMNMSGPITTAMMMDYVGEHGRASAMGVVNLMHSLPRALGPFIGGYLLSIGRLSYPFYFTGTLYTTSIALFYLFFGDRSPLKYTPNNNKPQP